MYQICKKIKFQWYVLFIYTKFLPKYNFVIWFKKKYLYFIGLKNPIPDLYLLHSRHKSQNYSYRLYWWFCALDSSATEDESSSEAEKEDVLEPEEETLSKFADVFSDTDEESEDEE